MDFLKKLSNNDRLINVIGSFDRYLSQNFRNAFFNLIKSNDKKPITIYIDSDGGEIYSFIDMFNLLSLFQGKIITIAGPRAQSCGALLLLCGNERYAFKNSSIMLHEASYGLNFTKNSSQVNHFKECQRIQEFVERFIKEKTKIKNVKEFLKQDYYFDIDEAIKLGVIDKII